MAQQPNICQTDYKSMFDTYPERIYISSRPVWKEKVDDPRISTEAQHGMLHGVLVLIHSSNVGREIVPSWC